MVRLLAYAAVVLIVLFAAAQIVRPKPQGMPIDPARTIQASLGPASGAPGVLDRDCGDCHSNRAAVWPWYVHIAPMSWVVANGVTEARKAVNYSDWAAYPPDQQQALLASSCRDAMQGKMPPSVYTALRPSARLTGQDIQEICAAAPKP